MNHTSVKKTSAAAACVLAIGVVAGCGGSAGEGSPAPAGTASSPAVSAAASPVASATATAAATAAIQEQPGRVYYEIFVRSFRDSDGDGVGDLKGVTQSLDYLKDLGVEGLWLMPIQPSPSYHGYDVTDYYGVQPAYGTMDDFKTLTAEAHKRGIKVIMDLVVNHTSSEHPWFKEAASDPKSAHRSWYTWAAEGTNLSESSATGTTAWHPAKGGQGSFLGTFWEGMPDLNFDNPDVRKEMGAVGQYWLKAGVDGFRLDAAKHIYENLASDHGKKEVAEKNVAWWKEFRSALTAVNPDPYLVSEVWENSPVSVAPYLAAFQSSFNFGAASEILKTVQSESGSSLASNLERAYGLYAKSSNGAFSDAVFLSNHDQDRVMSVLNGNADHAKMAASLLLTLPGNPFLYYGEEIGMLGKKPDEYIREPMLWNEGGAAGNGQTAWEASKFNRSNPVSVEAEKKDPQSLLNHYKTLIQWRASHPVLHDGGIASAPYSQTGLVSFYRVTKSDKVLVLHNVSGKEIKVQLKPEDTQTFGKLELQSKPGASLSGSEAVLPPYSSVVLH